MFLAWLVVCLITVWVLASRLVPWCLASLLSLYLGKGKVRLGSLGRGLQLHQLVLELGGVEVSVDTVRITSSILSSEASNLVTLIATGVKITINNDYVGSPEAESDRTRPSTKPKNLKTLLLLAQFLGVQVRGVSVVLNRLPSLPDCQLVTELGELRLDSSVIHRTRLSLALFLYQGSVKVQHVTSGLLLESNFAFQASIQALVGSGRINSVEEVNLDMDGLSVQMFSSLFQYIRPVKKDSKGQQGGGSGLANLAAFIPKAAQVKAECCSAVLEHTDRVAQLSGQLSLLYLSCKVTEPPRPGHLPDSHLTGQLSGLTVRPGHDSKEQAVLSLAKFQVLVQKDAASLHSDTQIHDLTACYSPSLAPWVAPISWLVRSVEKRKVTQTEPSTKVGWLAGLTHQHQLDAWNSDLTVLDTKKWQVSLHHVNLVDQPGSGPPTRQVSLRQARWCMDSLEVLSVGQVDTRLCGRPDKRQLDLMVTGTIANYTPELLELANNLKELVRPILMQMAPAKKTSNHRPLSVALLVSQTKVVWTCSCPDMEQIEVGMSVEVREFEAAGDPSAWETTVTGVKVGQCVGGEEALVCLTLPNFTLARKDKDVRLNISQRVKVVWSPSLHLTILRCGQEVDRVRNSLHSQQGSPKPGGPRNIRPTVHVAFNDKLTLLLDTGDHSVKVLVSSFTAKFAPPGLVSWLQAPRSRLKLDRKEVLALDELVLSLVPRSDKMSAERRRMQGTTVPDNACLLVAVNTLAMTEPYQFNLHKVFFGEVMGVVKWLKTLHVKKNREHSGSLPRDLLVNIKHFKFQLTDDPFEVKLRDNYELKEDEYLESQKRMKVLEQRVEELRRKNFMFPKDKVEELLANLKKRNADLYVQRARKIYSSSEPRSCLMEWNVTGLELIVLSDPSMQGRAAVLSHLQECDRESPWPPDHYLEFSTLWCRWVKMEATNFTIHLRDFPQHVLDVRSLAIWGKLAGAELVPGKRASRTHTVTMPEPWHDVTVERSLTPLKFYYDLACDVDSLSFAYGSCWEPAMTQCSLAMAFLTGTSVDPSPPLPWWDKSRLLLHGRLLLAARFTQLLLHASLDPYNTTEEMAVCWTDMELDWTEAQVTVGGTLDVYVRTASKYDDGHLLHLPALHFQVKMEWVCLANPLDHHSVMPCAPDKLPEYSSNQEHDSYRAFRSNHVNISIQLETKSSRGTRGERPKLDMFSSTLRWFENLKFIFSGASRPIRRGAVFNNTRPKKPNLSRHFKRVGFSVSFHQFQVNYWTSFSKQRGLLLNVARGINLSTEHILNLVPYKDGLKRRSRADWCVSFINGELTTSDIWIQSAVSCVDRETPPPSSPTGDTMSSRGEAARNMEKSFFFCVEKVVYMRMGHGQHYLDEESGKPTHKLVIHGARGAWTQSNRDMWFALYDSWRRAQILRKNVSSDALKSFHGEPAKPHAGAQEKPPNQTPFTSPTPHTQSTSSPFSWTGTGQAGSRTGVSMLDRLLQETEGGSTPTVYSEDMSAEEEVKHGLEAMAACTQEDIMHRNWSIELVNSQVLLKGIETSGYVIISAARSTVCQNIHRPVWKEKTLLSKTTWSGGLETMQYYATVSEEGADLDNIMWLTVDNIGEGEESYLARIPGPAGLVGSGKAVGGVVSQVVGVTDSPGDHGIQLQRIVSRCKAEFFYVSYGDTELETVEGGKKMVGPSQSDKTWSETETAVNAFSFVHHDLNASTNSLQYAMLLDIANNLLLYTEPTIKERTDRYLRMRYQFMLEIDNIDEQRKKIIRGQNQLRQLVCKLRQTEREIYMLSTQLPVKEHKADQKTKLELEASEIKDKLSTASEDLDMRIRCYRETQMASSQKGNSIGSEDKTARLRRRAEICFSKAVWRLTEIDGQLGIADLNISNFLFTRSSMSDDSVENLLEMGYVHVKNLLPNQVYENVLTPTELQRDMPVDRQRTLRVYSRERPRVGGISVRDHFEVNIAPLTICITAHFYKKMMNFAFPEKDTEQLEEDFEADKKRRKRKGKSKNANTSFYVACPNSDKDDVEKMKERAEKNKLFMYIKIPEVPIKVSYKGEKEKNQILDVADFHLQVPTLEYHNMSWTWLDLLLAIKSRTKESLVTQAIKQKFLRKGPGGRSEDQAPDEEEKARLLLGKQVGSTMGAASVKTSRRFLALKK